MVRNTIGLLVSVVSAVALSAGIQALLASNVGFLVNCPLTATGPGSRSGSHTVNLPYRRDAQLLAANDLLRDLQITNVANVQRFIESTDAIQVYTGRKGSLSEEEALGGHPNDFPIQPGECYFAKMLVKVDYVVGGSSDPGVGLALDAPGPASMSGTNFVSLPYHTIARTAGELMQDIGLSSVANVQRFITATDSLHVYTGRKGSPSPDFALDPCECYFIKMNTTVNYIPSHY
jgi:hypothetical protein